MIWLNKQNRLLYKTDGDYLYASLDEKRWSRSLFSVDILKDKSIFIPLPPPTLENK